MSEGPSAMETAIEKSHYMGKDLVEAIKEKRQYPEQEAAHGAWREGFKFSFYRSFFRSLSFPISRVRSGSFYPPFLFPGTPGFPGPLI